MFAKAKVIAPLGFDPLNVRASLTKIVQASRYDDKKDDKKDATLPGEGDSASRDRDNSVRI